MSYSPCLLIPLGLRQEGIKSVRFCEGFPHKKYQIRCK
jgi:hypothetical protein